ncbi:DUF6545 domain-containing protein [Streptomyces sp. NPDC090046]|uniref:DUF6545 domain-containing protein n=1 Tax=Streptomyces sp. NPDC090046 TaxID=3365928 RepID=UPI00381F77D5
MDLEQLRASCEARVEALGLPHRFSTRDLRDAVAEQRGRPIVLRPLSTLGAVDAPCGIRLETPDADPLFYEELDPGATEADTHDLDHHLHRWVIEINDCVLALRRYRQTSVRDAAAAEAARRGTAGTPEGDAEVEAAVIAAVVEAKRAGLLLDGDEAPPAAGTRSSKGDLPPETAWLLLVWDAHARGPVRENAGAAS